PGVVRMEIIDTNGKVLLNDRFALPAGVSAQPVNVSDLTSGIYFVSLRKGNQTEVQKFYKQ
ncbi:MAG: T9SS type A sorting domain-containing protein, partial [Bacteroidota bacterium]